MDWNAAVQMIEATVQIQHARPEDRRRVSTGLLVQAPYPDGSPRILLVTAAHAVEEAPTPEIRIGWRFQSSDGGWRFEPQPAPLETPSGQPYWARHPERDIAVIEISAPPEFARAAIPLAWLADDRALEEQGVGVGTEVFALGFPRGLSSNRAGFPILRSGPIASYPLSPITAFPSFLVDLTLFSGNSGGPVYLADGPGGHPLVLGLVTQQVERDGDLLGLAVVTHAAYIRETIAILDNGALSQREREGPARRAGG